MPDGTPVSPTLPDERLATVLHLQLAAEREAVAAVDGFDHPAARTIRPGWTGEPFDLHECVQALFRMGRPAEPAREEVAEQTLAA